MKTNMTKQERIELAESLFIKGYNCAQAVALAFADLTNVDKKIVETVSAPFGGGVGRMRNICGTISGMVITISLLRNYDCSDNSQKLALYAEEQELANRFKEKHGSIVCKELLEMAAQKHEDPTMANLHKHSCRQFVMDATAILADYLEEKGISL